MPSAPRASDEATARRKRADLASTAGAGVLGFGLGALLAQSVAGFAITAVLVGGALHGLGMVTKHALERGVPWREPWWSRVLYWGCWIALALLAAGLGWTLLR